MKKIFKILAIKLLFLVLAIGLLWVLSLYNGNIWIDWLGYQYYTNVFVLALIGVAIYSLLYVVKLFKKIFTFFLYRVSFQEEISRFTKNLELSSPIDKAITLDILQQVKDIETLRFFSYMSSLLVSKDFNKIHRAVRVYHNHPKWRNILPYFEVKAFVVDNKIPEAVKLCEMNLLSRKGNGAWAFLQLFDISFKYNSDADFNFLGKWVSKINLKWSRELLDKLYCLIHYKLVQQNQDKNFFNRQVGALIKRYPHFVPAYVTYAEHLAFKENKKELAIKTLVQSWQYTIAPENTIFCEDLFFTQQKHTLIEEAKKIIKSSRGERKDYAILLLVVLYAAYGDFLSLKEEILKVQDKESNFFKLVNLYLMLKETKDSRTIETLASIIPKSLQSNWWNAYLTYKPQ